MLKNYRTYLCAAGIGIATALHALGFLNDSLFQTISALCAAGGLAGLRSAVSK